MSSGKPKKLTLLRDFKDIDKDLMPTSVSKGVKIYFKLSFESLKAIYNDKLLLVALIGIIITTSALGTVFMRLIFIPIIYDYTVNDSLVGISRSILYFVIAIDVFFIGKLANKFRRHTMPIFYFLYAVFFVSGLIILLVVIPPTMSFNITAIIIIILLYVFVDALISEIGVNLQQRIFIDLIPGKYRNSILSLYSSISAILVTILYPIVGYIIEKYDLVGGLLFVGIVGVFGCLFLIPIYFSRRLRPSEKNSYPN